MLFWWLGVLSRCMWQETIAKRRSRLGSGPWTFRPALPLNICRHIFCNVVFCKYGTFNTTAYVQHVYNNFIVHLLYAVFLAVERLLEDSGVQLCVKHETLSCDLATVDRRSSRSRALAHAVWYSTMHRRRTASRPSYTTAVVSPTTSPCLSASSL